MARTREFEIESVLEQAMQVFWKHGFEGASLALLTKATGLHKGSLYSAFKSKEDLFVSAVDRYMQQNRESFYKSDGNAKAYLESFFIEKIKCSKEKKGKGCLLMNSGIELSDSHPTIHKEIVSKKLKEVQKNLENAVSIGKDNGEFTKNIDHQLMGERLLALAFTLIEMGKLGQPEDFLINVANGVLKDLEIQI